MKRRLKQNRSKQLNDPFYKKFQKEKAEKNSAVQILGQFSYYMLNLNVPVDIITLVLTSCGQKVKLESEKMRKILLDMLSSQNSTLLVN